MVDLYNGQDRILALGVAKSPTPRQVRLAPGDRVRLTDMFGPRLELTVEGCNLRYALPAMGVNYPWRTPDGAGPDYRRSYPVRLRLEPDFTLSLLSGKLDRKSVTSAPSLREHGYPLQPVSAIGTCP
jgi:hypothetical protein